MNSTLVSKPIRNLNGLISTPGDKSISHRSLILGLMAIGQTKIKGLLKSSDTMATLEAIRAVGAQVNLLDKNNIIINGVGIGCLLDSNTAIDFKNSGTGCRLMMGAIAGSASTSTLIGDESLSARPMDRVVTPLEEMGANIITSQGVTLPLTITGAAQFGQILPIDFVNYKGSAQVKSSILLAGLSARGITKVREPLKSRDHTERLLKAFGARILTENVDRVYTVSVSGGYNLSAANIEIPADPSSAIFPAVAALIVPRSSITLKGVGFNPLRVECFNLLKKMGGNIKISKTRYKGNEQIVDIGIENSKLKGIEVDEKLSVMLIDEYPILAIAASFAKGKTILKGLAELRFKESDRFTAIINNLKACGVEASGQEDNIVIEGNGNIPYGGASIDAKLDHRIAMSFLIMGLASKHPIEVKGAETIDSSFPGFYSLINSIGASIE